MDPGHGGLGVFSLVLGGWLCRGGFAVIVVVVVIIRERDVAGEDATKERAVDFVGGKNLVDVFRGKVGGGVGVGESVDEGDAVKGWGADGVGWGFVWGQRGEDMLGGGGGEVEE